VVQIYSHFGGIYCLHLQGKILLVYPKDSETVLLETWVDLYHSTRRHTSEVNNRYLTLDRTSVLNLEIFNMDCYLHWTGKMFRKSKTAAWSGILDGNLGLINSLTDQGGRVITA
jgi:hypothetical protein